jgi:predicted RNA-binding Zn ribbon-like protein
VAEVDLYPRRFKQVAGWLCLNFSNTIARYLKEGPDERLTSYLRLISWGIQAGLMDEGEARRLLAEAERRPAEAEAVLERARALRETIYRIFSGLVHGQQPAPDDLAALNAAYAQSMGHARIVPTADGFAWGWSDTEGALDWVLWAVARSAADLLVAEELRRVRECAGDRCGWLFLDKSKNQNRRWCETEVCGNRARVRRHYQRSKGA